MIQRILHTEIIAMAMLLRFLPRSDVTRLELGNPLCQVEALREVLDDQELLFEYDIDTGGKQP